MKKSNIIIVFSSHHTEDENQKFINHVNDTVGCKHKTVCYPNFNEFSLPEIYNKAIQDHNTEDSIMVFLHNDIIIKTPNWGRILLSKFNNYNYQILGVAGSMCMPKSGRWWDDRSKMIGIVEHTDGLNTWVSKYSKERRGEITPVVIIDGLFMAIDCNSIEHQFDEEFKGFHYYDISLCFENFLDGINVGVTTDIRILHKSIGITNEQWEKNRIQFVEKYKDELPYDYNVKDDLF